VDYRAPSDRGWLDLVTLPQGFAHMAKLASCDAGLMGLADLTSGKLVSSVRSTLESHGPLSSTYQA
jgi:hypothetical protein